MTWKAPKHAFDSDDLAVLDKAFEATWTAIQAQGPWFPPQREEEIRTDLRRVLVRLAAHGVADVHTLRDFALIAQSPRLLLCPDRAVTA